MHGAWVGMVIRGNWDKIAILCTCIDCLEVVSICALAFLFAAVAVPVVSSLVTFSAGMILSKDDSANKGWKV
jgi:hypothetical protein